ncbi:lactonase family protein [Gramella sp. GC03-9]|uniref:Lactonase family protein n=1 Tax=Christiangramia oceanisediminis TaxID=2920386 RepID=A0A9X2KYU5_9FLAO|nr:lactonase family protein [Gramella oceanisediminis]MCP9200626.1 lactonase family protein [Gramella oceanisediminis]
MKFVRYICLILVSMFVSSIYAQMKKQNLPDSINRMYVGTYTKKEGHVDGKAKGIYLLSQHSSNGKLNFVTTAAEIVNPSFVKVGKQGKYVYAVSELGPGDATNGFIYSFEIQPDGTLKNIGKLSTVGHAPCHIALDRSGKFIFVSNYLGGVVMVYRVGENGALVPNQELKLEQPDKAHAHSVKISRDNRYAYIADLGNDMVWIYDFDVKSGILEANEQKSVQLKDGAGPRHLSMGINGNFAFSINELNSTINTFRILKNGGLEIIQEISSLPASFRASNSAADIHIHPNGKFLYVSNRGHNSIGVFEIDPGSGMLSRIENSPIAGKTPRNFAIDPSGKYLYAASQDTGNISIFEINQKSGKLKIQPAVFEIPTPVCLEFVKSY